MSDTMTSTFRPGDRVRIEDDGAEEDKLRHYLAVGQTVTVDRVMWTPDEGTTLAVQGKKWDIGQTISQTVSATSVTLVEESRDAEAEPVGGDAAVEEDIDLRAEAAELHRRLTRSTQVIEVLTAQRDDLLAEARRRPAIDPTIGAMRALLSGSLPPGIDPAVTGDGHDDDGDAELTLAFEGYRWQNGRLVPNVREYEVEVEVELRATVTVRVEATDEDAAHDEAWELASGADFEVTSYDVGVVVDDYSADSWDVGDIREV